MSRCHPPDARLLLIQAAEALDALAGRSGVDQKDVFIAMQQSVSQALVLVQNNTQSELDQLITYLVQLEDNQFSNPKFVWAEFQISAHTKQYTGNSS